MASDDSQQLALIGSFTDASAGPSQHEKHPISFLSQDPILDDIKDLDFDFGDSSQDDMSSPFSIQFEYEDRQRTSKVEIESCKPADGLFSDIDNVKPDDMIQQPNTEDAQATIGDLAVPENGEMMPDVGTLDPNFPSDNAVELGCDGTDSAGPAVVQHEEMGDSSYTASTESPSEDPTSTQKQPSLKDLTKHLAEVAHCQGAQDAIVLDKASSAIAKLRQQSCDLMSTYSQLRFRNEDLINKKKQLQSDICENLNEPPLNIEIHATSMNPGEIFGSSSTFDVLPMDDVRTPPGYENLEVIEETYEEIYEGQAQADAGQMETSSCKKLYCRLGCVCDSLSTAGNRPQASKPIFPIVSKSDSYYSMSRLNHQQISRSSPRVTQKRQRGKKIERPQNRITLDDPKLKQKCFVRVVRLGPELDGQASGLKGKVSAVEGARGSVTANVAVLKFNDAKLRPNACRVIVSRVRPMPNCKLYCMEHGKRDCTCSNVPRRHRKK